MPSNRQASLAAASRAFSTAVKHCRQRQPMLQMPSHMACGPASAAGLQGRLPGQCNGSSSPAGHCHNRRNTRGCKTGVHQHPTHGSTAGTSDHHPAGTSGCMLCKQATGPPGTVQHAPHSGGMYAATPHGRRCPPGHASSGARDWPHSRPARAQACWQPAAMAGAAGMQWHVARACCTNGPPQHASQKPHETGQQFQQHRCKP